MISLRGVTKSYGRGSGLTRVLKGVDLEIPDGSFSVILGASGSGKTTLLNVMSGLERPDEGSVRVDGQELSGLTDRELTAFRKRTVGFVFQQYYLLPDLTVEKNVRMGADLAGNPNFSGILEAVGLGDKRKKYPGELSGGEQQRVSIARALAKRPQVLFADEPTGALDEQTGRQVLDVMARMRQKLGLTVVMVTHNQNIAQMADRVITMNSGKILGQAEGGGKSAFEIGW